MRTSHAPFFICGLLTFLLNQTGRISAGPCLHISTKKLPADLVRICRQHLAFYLRFNDYFISSYRSHLSAYAISSFP